MSVDDRGLRDEVDSFFQHIRQELGLEDPVEDDGELEFDDDLALPDPTPPAPVSEEPPSPAVPEAVRVAVDEEPTYPGSRHIRRGLLEEQEESPAQPEEEERWDAHPVRYRTGGVEREFFPISALATALRRKPGTLRKWEDRGYLPQARYRKSVAKGTDARYQVRLYTRSQIEGLVAIAEEEGVLTPSRGIRVTQTRFPERAHRLFAALEKRGA